jgi:hypothetical protein
VQSASAYLDQDSKFVVAVHCKAGKGRTGLMCCAVLLARGTCGTAAEALEFFAKHRTKDGKGVQIPSQKRYLGYYETMLRQYAGLAPPAPAIQLESITLSSTPRFDPDGGCDPFIVVSRRQQGHHHVPLGRSEALVAHPMEPVFDSRTLHPPNHINKQKDVRLTTRSAPLPGGDLRFEIFDYDQLSKNDVMMSFWVNTAFLPLNGTLVLEKNELDDAVKDKNHSLIDKDFVLTVKYTFAASPAAGQANTPRIAPDAGPSAQRSMPGPTPLAGFDEI